jgi:guanylate kinase
MTNGKLIILMGAMGSGKSTLMKHAIANFPQIEIPFSYTTRPRRADTIENAHYRFISREELEQKIAAGEFLEWAQFSGNYYGTLKAEVLDSITDGKILLKEMEVQGARQVKELLAPDQLLTVFLNAGGWDELQKRALARETIDAEHLEMRRKRFEDEITFMPEADIVIDNTTTDQNAAKQQFADLIQSILTS